MVKQKKSVIKCIQIEGDARLISLVHLTGEYDQHRAARLGGRGSGLRRLGVEGRRGS